MGDVLLDAAQAPLFMFTFTGPLTVEELARHLRDYQNIVDRGRPFVLMFDARNASMGDPKIRKAYADFLNARSHDLRLLNKGTAFVVTSSLIQGAITAVLWLAPLPFPHKTFTSMDDAVKWLQSRL